MKPASGERASQFPRIDELLELRHQAHSMGMASHHLVNSSFMGLYASVFRGQGLNFEEVREYRQGDDIRNMDWKVTARTSKPHLKVYREERERSVVLCVDQGPHMYFGTRRSFKSHQAARAAALIGWAANSQHDRVGGILFGTPANGMVHLRPTKDRSSLWRLLHELARVTPLNDACDSCLDQVLLRAERGAGTGALIFVIADFNRDLPGLEKRLVQLRQRHAAVLLPVDDPAERELPRIGRALFRGYGDEIVEIDTNDEAGRRAYRRSWETRREALVQLANRLGVALIPLSTGEDVHVSLVRGLRRRAQSRGLL